MCSWSRHDRASNSILKRLQFVFVHIRLWYSRQNRVTIVKSRRHQSGRHGSSVTCSDGCDVRRGRGRGCLADVVDMLVEGRRACCLFNIFFNQYLHSQHLYCNIQALYCWCDLVISVTRIFVNGQFYVVQFIVENVEVNTYNSLYRAGHNKAVQWVYGCYSLFSCL